MARIDLSQMPIRTANEVILGLGAAHEDVEIDNPDARHYIAVGLTVPITIRIRGSAGYFCGGLTDGPRIHVEKNVSWGVGDNMLSGCITVDGNAGAIAGEALRGGEVVIRGNMGSRAGQVMKAGTICCAGSSSFMAGYMMYGGRIIILGDSGERVGENMSGGAIFVGGGIQSVGQDAAVCDPEAEETAEIHRFLERFGIPFGGRFKKVVCAGRDLRFAKAEGAPRRIPYPRFSGDQAGYWNEKVVEDIRVKSTIGRYRVRGFGTVRHVPNFQDIAFKADLSRAGANPGALAGIKLRTLIGDKHGSRALDLSMPVMIAPMSFGAVSPATKQALGIASRLSGISENTGEGGMYSVERAEARQLIAQCLSGRFGWNIHDIRRADGVELYISQGAKPGLGGQLMGSKITPEIARMRGIPAGMDLRSPSRHPDVLGGDDLIMKIQEFREATGWRLPISLKLGGGRTRDDVKIAYKDGVDYIALDGLQGGTGAAGSEVSEYVGIPSLSALMEALDGLSEIDAEGGLPIVLMGGIQSGVDAAKALALGATAVSIGTPMLVAAGCTACMGCCTGTCPVGIATQSPEYVQRFDVDRNARRMHCYLESVRWQLAAVTAALGHRNLRQLSRDDLVALTPEAAALTRLPYDPETARRLRDQAPRAESSEGEGETATANLPRRSLRLIRRMAKTAASDAASQQRLLEEALIPRRNPFPEGRTAHLDDVVFLSAALTRLVIDPYREACSTRTRLSRTISVGRRETETPALTLELPFLAAGFDSAPEPVRSAIAAGLAETGCGCIGARPPAPVKQGHDAPPWLQLLTGDAPPDPKAAGIIQCIPRGRLPEGPLRSHPRQLSGLVVSAVDLPSAIPFALAQRMDLLLLDGAGTLANGGADAAGHYDLSVIRQAIEILRKMNREEDIALVYFGGLRSGTDVAKVLAMNCLAGVFGTAIGLAAGATMQDGGLEFAYHRKEGNPSGNGTEKAPTADEMAAAVTSWIRGSAQEAAVIARCTGKTDLHNLEPEDMRTISLATAATLGIPLSSGQTRRDSF